jgi:tetratricopeptide (TPR) repeat protein
MLGTIKIKNKYILYFLGFLIGGTLLSYLLLPGVLYQIAYRYDRKGMPFHAQVYYQRIIDYLPFKDEAYLMRGKHLADLYLDNFHMVYFPGSSYSWRTWLADTPLSREEILAEALFHLEECLKRGYLKPTDPYWPYPSVLNSMVPLLILDDRLTDAESLLNTYPGELDAAEKTFFRIEIALRQKNSEKALAAFYHTLQEEPLGFLLDEAAYLGRGLVGLGAYQEARDYYTMLLEEFARPKEGQHPYHHHYDRNLWIWREEFSRGQQVAAALLAGEDVLGRVEGRAYREGKPVEGLHVHLQLGSINGTDFRYSIIGGNWGEPHPPVTTDAEGFFSFAGVYPGRYGIGMRLAPEEMEDLYGLVVEPDIKWAGTLSPENKEFALQAGETAALGIHFQDTMVVSQSPAQGERVKEDVFFSWEPYPGAESYGLFLGGKTEYGSVRALYRGGIRENNITIPLEDLYAFDLGGGGGSPDGASMSELLGLLYRGEVYWYIEAHTGTGENRKTLSSTQSNLFGVDQSFFIPVEYNRAEKLLLAGKTRQAAEELKKTLEKDPDDARALRTLARLYYSGGKNFPKDRTQAKAYYAELYRLTGKEWYLEITNYR